MSLTFFLSPKSHSASMYLVIREDSAGLDFVVLTTWNELIHMAVLLWVITDLFFCCFLKRPSAVLLLSSSLATESHDPKPLTIPLPAEPRTFLSPSRKCSCLGIHSSLALAKEGLLSERLCFPTRYLKMNYGPACQSIIG